MWLRVRDWLEDNWLLIVLILLTLFFVTSCSSWSQKKYALEVQVKCPPETGSSVHVLPEILMAGVNGTF